MSRGRQHFLSVVCDLRDATHKWSHKFRLVFGKNEPFLEFFGKACGCKGPKFFAKFDLSVHALTHVAPARVSNDRTGTECAWTMLETALNPGTDLPFQEA